jgi:flagellar biosynthesis protein FlhA
MVSVAAALITTRSATEASLGEEVSSQLLFNPRPLYIAAGVLAFLGMLPGMPHLAFLLLAAVTAGGGYLSSQQQELKQAQAAAQIADQTARITAAERDKSEKIESLLRVDALALEVGYGLIPLVSTGDSFLPRVREIRRQIAQQLGLIVPPVHVTDNLQLAPREYAILLKGERVAQGELHLDAYLAIDPGAVREKIDGIQTTDPTFGMPAYWIRRAEDRDRALAAGYTVVDPTTVVCTHLSEIIRRHAAELLGRQETRALLDALAETHPKTVEEATPKVLSLGEVQRVLQSLLRERVPIRDLSTILEAIGDAGTLTRDVNSLTETARAALSRTICAGLAGENNELVVLALDPRLEQEFAARLGVSASVATAQSPAIDPEFGRQLLEKIEAAVQAAVLSQPIILCSSVVRPHLRRLTERFLPELSVIAHGEIAANVRLVSMGTIS